MVNFVRRPRHRALLHSSVSYSKLGSEETAEGPGSPESSIQFIPKGNLQRIFLVFAFLASSTITLFYMRYPTGYIVSDYMKNFLLDKSSVETSPEASESSKPSWTWTCEKTTNYSSCVRSMSSETSSIQSWKTCNMLCSDTPVWPLPTGTKSFSKTVVTVEMQNLALKILKSPSQEVSQYLQEAFTIMKTDIHKEAPTKDDKESKNKTNIRLEVRVTVEGDDADPRLRLDTNEKYNLTITTEEKILVVNIIAQSFCGGRHGFETLSQLVWYDHHLESVVALESAHVEDAPIFEYRGLLLDTARQYFPVEDILRTIDAMATSKLNTFHWHATDSQSFPLKLESVPQMALYGAYSLKQVYTAEDIRNIVHRARVRGIRVVIEVDAPAHVGRAWSWGDSKDLGELAYCIEHDPWHGYCGQPPCGQLNPTNDHVYEILEKIYKEIIELTGVYDVFHLGGDEVNQACWAQYMKGSLVFDTWYSFTQKALVTLQKANGGILPNMTIIWSSKLTKGSYLSRMKNYTIQLWVPSKWEDEAIIPQTGIRSIISNVDAWYLDCGFAGSCNPYRLWQTVYNNRPWENHNWNVAGGTACMWTERLAPEEVDARIWPRAAALAERLWADPPNKATAADHLRIDMQRQRLVERGIRADVIWPRWCTDNPYKCYVDT